MASVMKTLKTGAHHTKKIKNITKIEQKRTAFVYILGFIFNGASRAKTDLYNKYIVNFKFGRFFEQTSSIKLIYFRSLCEKMT